MGAPKSRSQMLAKAWGGFSDGKLYWEPGVSDGDRDALFAIYRTKREAKKNYEDVRRVYIMTEEEA